MASAVHANALHAAARVAPVKQMECDVVREGLVLFCPADEYGDAHTMLLLDLKDIRFASFDILLVDGTFERMAGCPVLTRRVCAELMTADENVGIPEQVQALWHPRI